ncbi:hypothetical protein SEA_ADGERS_45 [Gordonia phage Adgers]|uniref:Uncharacterized protein n=5 Tax=Montyvirus TaxID=2733196 RepID=A0A2L1IVD5_9CAUD|nr:hypothetical protein HWB50_gp089 [Gordonia phage Adgers]AVD99554.1 hypothetical protein SEA_BONEHAM_48 [Gordonia phage Boneham]QAY16434.1 hypothetical protein SEA_MSAY19_49 [Gordonia phage Msay19]QAY16685.1 hypothetical protein SEA_FELIXALEJANDRO_49 [Gordonia phage FelixAlejandro]QAY16973.1 hypothetical protein SEA_BUTTERBALL_48 [Gordonia phage Butterball]QIQ62748.1 hypothetical protein SEA_BREEZIC_44 [Gordonia phage Breezic]
MPTVWSPKQKMLRYPGEDCDPPKWGSDKVDENGFWHPFFEPTEPRGSFWLCPECGSVFIAKGEWWHESEMTWRDRRKAKKLRNKYMRERDIRLGGRLTLFKFPTHNPPKPPSRVPPKGPSGVSKAK